MILWEHKRRGRDPGERRDRDKDRKSRAKNGGERNFKVKKEEE